MFVRPSVHVLIIRVCNEQFQASKLFFYFSGGALENEFNGLNANEIFDKLGWAKSPPKPSSAHKNKRPVIALELLERARKRKSL